MWQEDATDGRVWREERVQMKLVDAKLTLESKYTQVSELLQASLEWMPSSVSTEAVA